MTTKIDTEIRRVTPEGHNIFSFENIYIKCYFSPKLGVNTKIQWKDGIAFF